MSEIEKKQDLSSVEYTDVSIGNENAKPFLTQLKGFWVTFAMMFRKVNTVQYPEVKEPTAPRFHGRHQLNRHPCLLYTSPSPRDRQKPRMPSSA